MSQERIKELEAIPGWEWDADTWKERKQNWITQYIKLQKTPSARSNDQEEKRAGGWMGTQRQAYNKEILSQERIKELEAIPGWEWDADTWDEQKQNWMAAYAMIQKAPSTISKDKDEKRAGLWQSNRRVVYKNGKMPQERITELEAISGWTWSAT